MTVRNRGIIFGWALIVVGLPLLILVTACNSASESLDPLSEGGLDANWELAQVLTEDPEGDQPPGSLDLGEFQAFMDEQFLYLRIEILSGGNPEEFNISLYQSDDRQYWIYYFPETDIVEYSTPIGRRPVEGAQSFYGGTLDLIIPLEIFEKEIERIGLARVMTDALTTGDEVKGGAIPNQLGEVVIPTPELLKTLVATQQAFAEKGAYLSGRDFEDLSEHAGLVRIMTFNILFGGQVAEAGTSLDAGRIPQIIEVIDSVDPDIIGFQELNGWRLGEPAMAAQISERLGMDYVYCEDLTEDFYGHDTALFSCLEIVDSQTYPEISNCFIRTELQMPAGQRIQIFTNHVTQNMDLGCNEPVIRAMLEVTSDFVEGPAILMGDFNINNALGFSDTAIPDTVCYSLLKDAGWYMAAITEVDVIYVSESMLQYTGYQLTPEDYQVLGLSEDFLREASDHRPVTWDLLLTSE